MTRSNSTEDTFFINGRLAMARQGLAKYRRKYPTLSEALGRGHPSS
jgi:hypothetical protein